MTTPPTDIVLTRYSTGDEALELAPLGAWVRYDEAAAELARLREQLRVLREECKAWKAWSNAIGSDEEDVTWEALKQAQDATSAMENP